MMFDERYCDFCDRSESEIIGQSLSGSVKIEMDPDGLWACSECQTLLVSAPVGEGDGLEIDVEIKALVGRTAGAICHVLNLPYEPPYRDIIDAASKIAYDEDRHMSAWSFVTQWMDGTTVWRASDGSATAIVPVEGAIQVAAG